MTGGAGREWLEADGLGGFASGAADGIRTRRYHALLLAATRPPTGRVVLVNGFDAWVEMDGRRVDVSSQRYAPDVVHPDGAFRIESFDPEPWPAWTYRLDETLRLEQEVLVAAGSPLALVCWRLRGRSAKATLHVRPFLSGRDYHSLHHENHDFRFEAGVNGQRVSWRPYASQPGIVALSNGTYVHEPLWYRSFLYEEERARGLDFAEDLAAPGSFRFDLAGGEAVLMVAAASDGRSPLDGRDALTAAGELREAERQRRGRFPSRLHRAADAYLVRRGDGRTIVAGYPWFADWGRDTFIALRGLCLATGRLGDARDILFEWSHAVSEGMLPNRFPDRPDEAPEFNAVDASLWYVIAVHDYLRSTARGTDPSLLACPRCGPGSRCLEKAVDAILAGHATGTRHGIRLDADGLLAAGEPGVQLTWMDAKVGDWVVTPRIGKPVEVQALWLNALRVASAWTDEWQAAHARGLESFVTRFWNEEGGFLHDVVDVDHRPGTVDPTFRPNQVFAVGGLPWPLLTGERARRVIDAVEQRLLTPMGLRSLAPGEPEYAPRYRGGVRERDGAYHQGTVWPWLLGPFVEGWVRTRPGTAAARREALARFVEPLLQHLDEAGLGHVSEVADGDAPHVPGGCPFQAWSVGELLRVELLVLAETPAGRRPRRGASTSRADAPGRARPGAARPLSIRPTDEDYL